MQNNFVRIDTPIEGLYVLEPRVYSDHRGFFMESYSKQAFEAIGIRADFVQDNHSKSMKNVLRGIHFQHTYPQGKLVRAVKGRVFDVAVDLRPGSVTYGQWFGVELSEDNKKMFYIPEGFGHGFLTQEDDTEFMYKATDYYHPEDEGGIRYDDPDIGIQWPETDGHLILSDKDKKLGSYADHSAIYNKKDERRI